jgi:hypothetical protein
VNLPTAPRHNKQLNGGTYAFKADTPNILTTFFRLIERFPQVSKKTLGSATVTSA